MGLWVGLLVIEQKAGKPVAGGEHWKAGSAKEGY